MIKNNYHIVFLTLLGIIFFIPFLGNFHLFDWDEINFAESAREMIVTGDYFLVRINYDPFWEKPPFFMWLQVLSMKIFGINEFAARLPNAIFGIITLLTLYFIGKKHVSKLFGIIWALFYFSSFLPHLYAKSGIIDPIFNYFIFTSIYFLILNLKEENNRKKALFAAIAGGLIGLAIITKGPVGLLLVLLTFLTILLLKKFKLKIRIKDILLYAFCAFVVTFAWFGYEVIQNGPWFIVAFIRYQIELFSQPVAGHQQPFFYHFVVVLLGCFPMSIIALGGFKKQKSHNLNQTTTINFLLWMKALFWVVLILFSIVTTKIVHYSSMAYLPLSFIAAYYFYQVMNKKEILKRYVKILFFIFGFLFSILLILTPVLFYEKEFLKSVLNDSFAQASLNTNMGWTGFEFLCGCIYLVGVFVAGWYLIKQKYTSFIYTLCFSVGLTLLSYSIFVVPKIEKFSQGPAIEFLQKIKSENAYITTIGHKSYAPYFYGEVKQVTDKEAISTVKKVYLNSLNQQEDFNVIEQNTFINDWLLTGDIDKDTYFITKINQREEMKKYPLVQFLYNKGGFDFYKRVPVR